MEIIRSEPKKWPTWEEYKEMGEAAKTIAFTDDGCTSVPDFTFAECCREHDYHYTTQHITRAQADKKLKACIRTHNFRLLPTIYYWGARIFGWRHWRNKNAETS